MKTKEYWFKKIEWKQKNFEKVWDISVYQINFIKMKEFLFLIEEEKHFRNRGNEIFLKTRAILSFKELYMMHSGNCILILISFYLLKYLILFKNFLDNIKRDNIVL